MSRLERKLKLAKREQYRSVIAVNDTIVPNEVTEDSTFYGVKDTDQIPENLLANVRNHKQYVWLTTDKASDKGRAIDTDLINPLTYRVMTGSTSGGPINILKGINDFAIGTDGGGSVLGPAISCQLPSIMCAGLGLHVKNRKVSTDGITFSGSVGVIGKSLSLVKQVVETMIEESLNIQMEAPITIAIPEKGSVIRPDGKDMHMVVKKYIDQLPIENFNIIEINMKGIDEREQAITTINKCFERADLIITCEGPVDVYGYGETIPQQFGKAGKDLAKNHGKYLIRAANMCKTTAVTVPTNDLASGLVVIGQQGLSSGRKAICLAEHLEKLIKLPDVWYRYFIED